MSRVSYEYIVPCSQEIEQKTQEYASELPPIPAGSGYSYKITVTDMYGHFYVVLQHRRFGHRQFCVAYDSSDQEWNNLNKLRQIFEEIAPVFIGMRDAFRPQPIPIKNEILHHFKYFETGIVVDTRLISKMIVCLPDKELVLNSPFKI